MIFRTDSDRTTIVVSVVLSSGYSVLVMPLQEIGSAACKIIVGKPFYAKIPYATCLHTFIFAYVFQCVGGTIVFALDDSDLAKGSFANDSEKTEVIEVD